MKRFLSVSIISVLAAGVLLAGCDDTAEKNAYADTVNGIQTEMSTALTEATSAAAESPEEAAEQLDNAAAIVGDALADLRAVDVPEDAAAGHADLVDAIAETEELFSSVAGDLREIGAEDIEGLFEIQATLRDSINEITPKIDAAIDKINEDMGAEPTS